MIVSDASAPHIDAELVNQAIAWSVRLRLHIASATELQDFIAWRQADPMHEAAWQRIESMQQQMTALPPQISSRILAESARSAARRKGRRNALKLMLAGGLVGAGAYAGRDSAWVLRAAADYSTGVGSHRVVVLEDGSEVLLNTSTAIKVRYAAGQRLIEVSRGEIRVTTGADALSPVYRPFLVVTTDGRMLAKGTRFLVRKEPDRTRLTVQEHAVEMHSADAQQSLLATAGDSYYMARNEIVRADASDFDPTAWTDGLIAAREMRMEDFLRELSRYRSGILRCDPAVAGLPVSGVFQLHDTDRTIEVLLATQPVAAVYRTRWWVTIIARRPQ